MTSLYLTRHTAEQFILTEKGWLGLHFTQEQLIEVQMKNIPSYGLGALHEAFRNLGAPVIRSEPKFLKANFRKVPVDKVRKDIIELLLTQFPHLEIEYSTFPVWIVRICELPVCPPILQEKFTRWAKEHSVQISTWHKELWLRLEYQPHQISVIVSPKY